MTTNYKDLLPKGILFNLKEVEELSILKVAMAKKLIGDGKLETVKIGNKLHISRLELLRFLEENTTTVSKK
ncbi:MAG: DNA-binding protein [Epsilonproteobacteria bacterium]|nr:MAG: DNA-binding protein [Campylobacterota bacterium]